MVKIFTERLNILIAGIHSTVVVPTVSFFLLTFGARSDRWGFFLKKNPIIRPLLAKIWIHFHGLQSYCWAMLNFLIWSGKPDSARLSITFHFFSINMFYRAIMVISLENNSIHSLSYFFFPPCKNLSSTPQFFFLFSFSPFLSPARFALSQFRPTASFPAPETPTKEQVRLT